MKCIITSFNTHMTYIDIDSVKLVSNLGEMVVLKNHEECRGTLKENTQISINKEVKVNSLKGGFFLVKDNVIDIFYFS